MARRLCLTSKKDTAMKKTYKTPVTLCVAIRTTNMMAFSEYSVTNEEMLGTEGDIIEAKQVSNINVWDEEW